jgi:hypothetical protein
MAIKILMTQLQTWSSSNSVPQGSTSSQEATTAKRSNDMKKFSTVIAHSALVATLLTLLSTVASASAVWGN